MHVKADSSRIVTGGVDCQAGFQSAGHVGHKIMRQVVLYNSQKQKKVQTMVGHAKKAGAMARSSGLAKHLKFFQVTAVKLHGDKDVVVSASQDATAKVWTCGSPDWTSQCPITLHIHLCYLGLGLLQQVDSK